MIEASQQMQISKIQLLWICEGLGQELPNFILTPDRQIRHPTVTESPAFTSSVAQLASAFDC
jgi:hypothetical protein